MSWEQDISEQLQEVQDVAVRFDIPQYLDSTEKARARSNIGFSVTASQIHDNDYRITMGES